MLDRSNAVPFIRHRARRPSLSSTAASPKTPRRCGGKRTFRVLSMLRNVQPASSLGSDLKQTRFLDRHNFQKIINYSAHARKYPGPVTL